MSGLNTRVTVFGTGGAVPEVGGDSPSFLINDKYLVDTGWAAVQNLREHGVDPLELDYLIFTHFHHDHYLSLPSLLFYFLSRGNVRDLKIIGPAEDLERMVKRALDFLDAERYWSKDEVPTLIPLQPGDSYETEDFRLDTCSTIHPVQGLAYRFTDARTDKSFTFSGDTAYHPPIAELAKGSLLLIHEAALGPKAADPNDNAYMHSGSIDAARIAEAAGVATLLLLHGASSRVDACLETAKQAFNGSVEWPHFGQTFVL
ncbi:MBL fold metallo-hydrolase [Paenibacillus silvisoli]|uniref:MBL fold metallo-hydrolase n=1 Tax=Paenibacillus silvisoli TaxID=3110539 RepID=UPI0028048D8B|nr:ribonuclease Z [Paenibacillus silvisoli]